MFVKWLDFNDCRNDKDQKFVMSGDFDMAAFEAFVRDFLAGNLEPYLKSEPLPADGNAGEKKTISLLSIN